MDNKNDEEKRVKEKVELNMMFAITLPPTHPQHRPLPPTSNPPNPPTCSMVLVWNFEKIIALQPTHHPPKPPIYNPNNIRAHPL